MFLVYQSLFWSNLWQFYFIIKDLIFFTFATLKLQKYWVVDWVTRSQNILIFVEIKYSSMFIIQVMFRSLPVTPAVGLVKLLER